MSSISDIKKQIDDKEFKRYVVSVVSWQEQIVVDNLKERVKKNWLDKNIVDYLNPVVKEISYKKWKKVLKQKKLYPGYVFVKTQMNDKIWYIIRNTPWIRIIVWADTRPVPVTEKEYQKILSYLDEKNERFDSDVPFKIWDIVSLNSWDFSGMQWKVKKIDIEAWTLQVNIDILWRDTPVILEFDKVELK